VTQFARFLGATGASIALAALSGCTIARVTGLRPRAERAAILPTNVWLNPTDSLTYVRIQPTTFLMGCVPRDAACKDDEKPRRWVTLTRAYFIGRTEVTIAAFERFARATGYRTRAEVEGRGRFWNHAASEWQWLSGLSWRTPLRAGEPGDLNWPALQVEWTDAAAFCAWAGGRLPSEAEWELAARGGNADAVYPWGDAKTPQVGAMKFANAPDVHTARAFPSWKTFPDYDDGYTLVAPVASFAPNGFGIYDMAGNAWEWLADWYAADTYRKAITDDPRGAASGTMHVVRGGAWGYAPADQRASARGYAEHEFWTATFGFRCAADGKTPFMKTESDKRK
jgi:formylglycine-generating enzyme required for sulfatase activity